MAVLNSSLVLLSIFLTITSLMAFVSSEFAASSLPQLHTAATHTQTHSPSDDSSTASFPHSSSVNPALRLMSGNIDSTERDSAGDETKEVRLETSDAPRGDFAGHVAVMLMILITLVCFGAKVVNFVLLPVTTVIIMIVLIVFRFN